MAKPAVPDFSGIPGWHQFETNDYGRMKMVHVLVCIARKLLLVTVVYVFWKESNAEFPGKAVLSDPVKRREYDKRGMLYVYDYHITEYLNRYKGLILTCNGLGMKHSILSRAAP
ncbi:hypothetical protein CJ030_MR8G020767 [Morella rubra]|uniref:Uncharacterized protein n=1 Tax=Morella rubra TaxID=262757 RepID=A0A6A1UU54_9ROSI|nr:hypothetical protein CJ030_MR8G020767 [Morella rubra]